jgi:hypothetical protein
LYNSGYWDYPLEDRGLLFAPVYFNEALWDDPGWYFQPYWYVGFRPLLSALWFWPRWGWFFFGDWWGRHHWGWGSRPWFGWGSRFGDPLFGYFRWANRGNPGWYTGLRNTYLGRQNGTLAQPARTFAAQRGTAGLVRGLNQAPANMGLASLPASQRVGIRNAVRQNRNLTRTRSRIERANARRGGPGSPSRPARRLGAKHDGAGRQRPCDSAGQHLEPQGPWRGR